MPNKYCGVKLNVAGFEKKALQRLGQINQMRIVLLSYIKKPRHRKVEKGIAKRFRKNISRKDFISLVYLQVAACANCRECSVRGRSEVTVVFSFKKIR